MNFDILLGSVVLLGILMGIFVLNSSSIRPLGRILLGSYISSVVLWSFGILLCLNFPTGIEYTYGSLEFLVAQVLFIAAGAVFLFSYLFIFSYQKTAFKLNWKGYIAILYFSVFAFLMAFTDKILLAFSINEKGYIDSVLGGYAGLFTLFILYCYFITLWDLSFRIKRAVNLVIKSQLKIMLWSYAFFITSMILTNWFLPVYFESPELNNTGPLFYLFEIFFLLYAITQYRFLDIKLTFLRVLKAVLAFIIAIFLSSLTLFWLKYISNFSFSDTALFIFEGALTLMIYFQTIWFFDSRFMDDVFGEKSAHRFRALIDEFRNSHFIYDSVDRLKKSLSDLFVKSLNIGSCELVVLNKASAKKYESVLKYFETHNNDVLVMEEIPYFQMKSQVDLGISKFIKQKGEVFVPLANPVKGVIGILILGKKQRGIYLSGELSTLRTFGHYLSLVLTGILYNADLKGEVKLKTKQLAEKNRKLKKSYEKLRVFDEAKDNFLAIASHELRTPMTVIKGYTDFLLSDSFGSLNKKQTTFVEYVQESTEDLLALVNDMLDLSKIESGQMDFQFEKIKVGSCVASMKSAFGMECEKRKINFDIIVSDDMPKYMILDPQKVRLVMTNLIGNAMKFTPEGGSILVDIAKRRGERFRVSISDTGIGISKESLGNIFDKFFQEKSHLKKEYKGTGLGLAIVKKIIEKVGGTIKVRSKLGEGTTFILDMPIRAEA